MSTPNEMRKMIGRMRGKPVIKEEDSNKPTKNMDVRDMLKITRDIHEGVVNLKEEILQDKETVFDQSIEEEKFRNFFNDMNVSIKFIDLEVFDDFIFWGGTVDGVIQFVYKVTPDENTSGVEFNYLEDFSPDNPENEEIIGRIESYFDNFYKYWRDNVLQPNADNPETEKDEPEAIEFKSPDELSNDAEDEE
jgi:hypothetical protein